MKKIRTSTESNLDPVITGPRYWVMGARPEAIVGRSLRVPFSIDKVMDEKEP